MLTVDQPVVDWSAMARAQGVDATRVTDLDGLIEAMRRGLATKGPSLIEVVI
jgi:acetolactate synthase-1/2/3 large subunit